VLERVTKTARAHGMFEPGDLVLVSCSGGPDSVCLLYALWHLRRLFRIRLAVFHFDHRLRPGSGKDAAYVRRLADRLELPFHLRAADDAPLKGESVEAWAREARQMAAQDVAEDVGARRIAEGHTLDDQAETVLMAALTGGNALALMGIWPKQGPTRLERVQPLLAVSRDEVESFCRARRLSPRRDPTNEDTSLLRNAIRLEAIPAIERITGRQVRGPLARLADDLRPIILEQLMTARARDGSSSASRRPAGTRGRRGEWFELGVGLLDRRSPTQRRTLIRGWLKQMRLPVSSEALDAIVDLAEGRPGRRRDLPQGLKAIRGRGYVRVVRASPES
jgi:tRNA(Ile)-lysidine synthetase-like protein